jgi:predicted nucleic acid-binding protein
MEWVHREIDIQRLGILDLILCEVLQGVVGDRKFDEVQRSMLSLKVFATGGIELSVVAAQNYRTLRARGKTVRKTVDCLIATYCILNDYLLLHADSDFDTFEKGLGLKVMRPDTDS